MSRLGPRTSSSRSADAMFPDLHHRMSKKIAQLTKVIYHLSIKTDDHDAEIEGISASYEQEIHDILQEASKKIRAFQQMLEQERSAEKASKDVAELRTEHQREMDIARQTIQELKLQVQQKEEYVRKAAEDKLHSMTKDLASLQEELRERAAEFAEAQKALDARHEREVADLKELHQREVSELVQSSNRKYNEMLSLRLQAEEDMKTRLQQQRETELANERKHAQKVADELNAELATAAIEINTLKESIATYESQMEEMKQRLTKRNESLQVTVESLQARLDAEIHGREQVESQLRASQTKLSVLANEARVGASEASARAASLAEELEGVRTLLEASNQELHDTKHEANNLREKLHSVRASMKEHDEKMSTLVGKFEAEKHENETKLRTQSKRLADMDLLVKQESDRAKRAETELSDATRSAEQARAEVESVKTLLSTKVESLHREEAARADLEIQRQALETALENRTVELQSKATLVEQLSQQIENLREQNQRDGRGFEERCAQLTSSLRDNEELLEKERQRSDRLAHENTQAKEKNDRLVHEIESVRAKLTETRQGLETNQAKVRQLNENLAVAEEARNEIERNLGKEITELKRLLQEGDARHHEIILTAENAAADARRAAQDEKNHRAELENQIRNLEVELQREHARAVSLEKKVAVGLQEADVLRGELDRERARGKEEAAELIQAKASLNAELQEAIRTKDATISNLKEKCATFEADLQQEAQQRAAAAAKAAAHEAQLAEESAAAVRRLEETIEQAKIARENEVANVKAESAKENERCMSEMRDEMERQKTLAKQVAERDKNAALAELCDQLARDAEERVSRAVLEVQTKLRVEFDESKMRAEALSKETLMEEERRYAEAMEEAERKSAAALAELQARHTQELAREAETRSTVVAELEAEKMNTQQLQDEAKDLQHKLDMQTKAAEEARRAAEEAQRAAEEARARAAELDREHRRAVEQLVRENVAETRALQQEFEGAQHQLKLTIEHQEREMNELQIRFENRESRPEDLSRIAALESDVEHAKELVAAKDEEMRYFKLELQNREENYNKVFGASPNVGIMSVKSQPNAKTGTSAAGSSNAAQLPPLGGRRSSVNAGSRRRPGSAKRERPVERQRSGSFTR